MIYLGQSQVFQKKGKCVNIGTGATVKIVIANILILQKIARFVLVEISAEVVNVESGTEKCVGTGMTQVVIGRFTVPICIEKPSQKKVVAKKVKETEEVVKKVKESEDIVKKVKETGETVQKVKETEEIVKKVKETGETVQKAKEAMEAETVETEYLKAVIIAVMAMW